MTQCLQHACTGAASAVGLQLVAHVHPYAVLPPDQQAGGLAGQMITT